MVIKIGKLLGVFMFYKITLGCDHLRDDIKLK